MGAKTSTNMLYARQLMESGKTQAEAARLSCLSHSALSRDPVCKKLQLDRKLEKSIDDGKR
jgi:hypothetical protein